ncbi:unnamed protein product [Toxocara canis]|uniref:Reverse transcriptase domain-containing protein n=1 Tax=Toxocara canis TaxID=6265 RepID=A0A183U6C9_TOXCA|nr:unnamed protein product [Toxocara canis]
MLRPHIESSRQRTIPFCASPVPFIVLYVNMDWFGEFNSQLCMWELVAGKGMVIIVLLDEADELGSVVCRSPIIPKDIPGAEYGITSDGFFELDDLPK